MWKYLLAAVIAGGCGVSTSTAALAAGAGGGLQEAGRSGGVIVHEVQQEVDRERRRRDGAERRGNRERGGQRRPDGQRGQGAQRQQRQQGGDAARQRAAEQQRRRAAEQQRQRQRGAEQQRRQQERLRAAQQARERAVRERQRAEEARRRAAERARNATERRERARDAARQRTQEAEAARRRARAAREAEEAARRRAGEGRRPGQADPDALRTRRDAGRPRAPEGVPRDEGLRRGPARGEGVVAPARERAGQQREGERVRERQRGDGPRGERGRNGRAEGDAAWRRRQAENREERRRARRAARERGEVRRARERWRRQGERVTERRTRREWVRRLELMDPQGRRRVVRSRRYWARDQRYRNRWRRGRSIYYLPPVGAAIALGAYLVSSANAGYDTYVDTFLAPPVVDVDERYTLEEIIEDPAVRAKVRSVNLDSVNFDSGSATLSDAQLERLEEIADAMLAVIDRRPDELFLIAGHTDAVGGFEQNLALSEERAAAVQEALVVEYGVPAENLESVGYGEQYLLVNTLGSSRANRRVTVRAVGSLLARR